VAQDKNNLTLVVILIQTLINLIQDNL